jgi:hypothetical protein
MCGTPAEIGNAPRPPRATGSRRFVGAVVKPAPVNVDATYVC